MSTLPFESIRILELGRTLTARLTALLFADQGADVYLVRAPGTVPEALDEYLDRGKTALPQSAMSDLSSADVIIVDGDAPVSVLPHQILMRVTAALPGDEDYGHLEAGCSDDVLNALVGFFTDMGTSARYLGRPVIYTPLPLCSIYAGVNGAVAIAASLVDRERTGLGRTLIVSRLASGLSAIGALCLTSEGLPEHLAPTVVGGLPEGLSAERFKELAAEAIKDPARQLWLEQRFIPLAVPYRAADNRLVLPVAAPNRRLTRKMLQHLGLWEKALAAGMVDASCYKPENRPFAGKNLSDSMALNFHMTSRLADLLEQAFAQKTASEWEREFCALGIPCVAIQSWAEWKQDAAARKAGLFAHVKGHDAPQIGRSAWLESAQPYPEIEACRTAKTLPLKPAGCPKVSKQEPAQYPLTGFVVIDFSNVIAGPSAGRMLAELGATVYQVVPARPEHSPTIVLTWAGESSTGKQSIIIDATTAEGLDIIHDLVKKADLILANMLDEQMVKMGLDAQSLKALNPKAIGVQLAAYRGPEHGPRHDYPGYDPALQGSTGIMTRFGPEGCPTYHGVASTVDYLCGYLAVWAGVMALVARERRQNKRGDWATTSLAAAATLAQLSFQQTEAPASARGPYATGMNEGARIYAVREGFVFAEAPENLSNQLADKTMPEALEYLAEQHITAVPVQTCRQLAGRHRASPCKTVRFQMREKDGWKTEGFAPTWFAFDGKPADRLSAPSRIGADAVSILTELGYSKEKIEQLFSSKTVGKTEFQGMG